MNAKKKNQDSEVLREIKKLREEIHELKSRPIVVAPLVMPQPPVFIPWVQPILYPAQPLPWRYEITCRGASNIQGTNGTAFLGGVSQQSVLNTWSTHSKPIPPDDDFGMAMVPRS